MINYKTYRLFACNRISACLWNMQFFIGLSLIVGACATGPATKTQKTTTTTPALSGKETLLTIDNTPVAVEEFLYVYNKNNNDSIQYSTAEERDKALRDYLDLFINFKLKVKAAKAEGLDQSQGFKKELARYQKQLAKPYLIENQVTEQLVQETYARLQQEVHASHILIELAEDASPADTLKAYRTIDSLRNLAQHGDAQHGDAQQGVPFDKLARENSSDPSAAMNGGDLGYFTALQMVYPFENAAYNTPVGEVSLPIRSQFGYHIVKVHDRRPARGKVKVAHIMLRLAPNAAPEEETKTRDEAFEIYQQLQKGGDWNELCERFSEDVSTKSAGGSLPYFGTGSMLGAFEEAAFALKNKGDVSEPVRTQFGWHILKLEDKKPVDSLEKLRPELERKIAQSVRSEVLRKDMVSKLKKENNFQADSQVVQSILQDPSGNEVNTAIANPETTLFTLNDTAYTVGSFYRYAEAQHGDARHGDAQKGNTDMAKLYNSFVEEQVLAYEEAHLAEKHDAYRLLLNEYYDGILLFEMMEKEVWAKATKDTVGLQHFFDTHKTQYQWKERVEATLFEVPNEGVVGQLQKSLTGKKFPLDEDTQKGLEKAFSEKGTPIEIFYGTYEREQTRYATAEKVVDKVNWTKGETQITANGKVYLIKIHEVLPPGPKKLSEIRGIVIADYQNHLEKEWVDSLKQVYVINVNEDVLQKVIQSLQ